jgi:hypothetical protein
MVKIKAGMNQRIRNIIISLLNEWTILKKNKGENHQYCSCFFEIFKFFKNTWICVACPGITLTKPKREPNTT